MSRRPVAKHPARRARDLPGRALLLGGVACLTVVLGACGDGSTSPTTGSLAITVAVPPTGIAPHVRVTGPNGFTRTLSSSDTLEALAAGSYVVTADTVVATGSRFAGSPGTQQLEVSGGRMTPAAAISYAVASARLTIGLLGLPAGAAAAVTVTGPGGFNAVVMGPTTLDLLAPGSYTVNAASITAAGRTYRPSPTTQSLTLAASVTPASVDIDYGAGSATLEISMTGLPSGTEGAVTVTGPDGYARTVTGPRALEHLVAGQYTITAAIVGSNLTTHAPVQSSQTIDVTDGVTSTVTVAYGSAPLELRLDLFAEGLTAPVFLTAPAGDSRQFIVERNGRVRIVENGTLLATPFLDIRSRVNFAGERGMLSMAFDPQYATTGLFYVYYVDLFGDMVVERFTSTPGSNVAGASSGTVLVFVHRGENHHGGLITFGPDGMLYVAPGDGGCCGDPQNNAQRNSTLLGKMLRIDVRTTPYTIPIDNPYTNTVGARGEIWASGLRNPWRYSFDAATGLLYIADVGDNAREEVNVVRATSAGLNYGWRLMEGTACFNPAFNCNPTGALTLPALDYTHNEGCSVTGGYVYRGRAIPELTGHYLYADFCRGWIRSFRATGPGLPTDQRSWDAITKPLIVSFGVDGAGEMYVITTTQVWRLARR